MEYNQNLNWNKQNPCSFKFRNSIFYVEDSKYLHNVSPNKYLPKRKFTEESRYNKIGMGYGKKGFIDLNKGMPGPGEYNLPSLFKKGKQGRYPLN